MSKLNAVFSWTRLLAPLILANVAGTRALAGHVASMLDEAENLGHAKGVEKLQHVLVLARGVGETINQQTPGTVNLDALDGAMAGGINLAFQIAQITAQSHGAPASPPAIPIVPGTLVLPPGGPHD